MFKTFREDVDLVGKAERFWRPIHEQVDWKARWLYDGEHWNDDERGASDGDRREMRWVGQETFNLARHEAGAVTSAPSSVHARPVDEFGDDDLAERAVSLVESETENPIKCFEDECEGWVADASVLGYSVLSIEYHEHVGPWGELAYVTEDSRDVMWDPRAKNIHHPACRWVMVRRRVPIGDLKGRRGWKASVIRAIEKAGGDGGYNPQAFGSTRETYQTARASARGSGTEVWDPGDETTLYFLWYRAGRQAKRQKPGTFKPLAPGTRYLHCPSCGWQSATETEFGVEELPESAVCDQCGGKAVRADAEEQEQAVYGYPDIRLKIIAPYAGVDDYLYDGPAPWPTRSFPMGFLARFRHPSSPVGPSIVDINAFNQMCTDMLMTLAVERMAASAPIWSVPDDGVFDGFGERFEFTDEQGHVMFRSSDVGAGAVQLLEGTGIPANWSGVYQAAQGSLVSHQGIADLGMTPTSSRDIAASSLAQQIQQQEIPVAHFQRRYQRARGMLYGLIYDALKGTYPHERVARLRGPGGADAVQAMNASDMPNFDFILTDAPDFTALDEAKQKGLMMLMQIATERPAFLPLFAQLNHIPPSTVREVERLMRQEQEQAAQAAAMAAGPGAAGAVSMGTAPGTAAPAAAPMEPMEGEDDAAMVEQLIAEMFTMQQQ